MKSKKMQERLDRRVEDWKRLEGRLREKANSRYRAGGYRCPGSPKQN